MRFNTKNVGQWFYFDPDNEKDGGVCLRPLTIGQANKINRLCSKQEQKFLHKNVYQWANVDETKYNQLLWDYCIVDWKNVTIEDGKELECTLDNKILLMNNSNEFVQFVIKHLDTLTQELEADIEAIEKN